MNRQTLFFNRSSFAHLLGHDDYFAAVANAHRLHAEGHTIAPSLLHTDAPQGEYHLKTGGLLGERAYFGLKANGGFFQNRARHGLPNIQGIIYLSDAETGYSLGRFAWALST